MYPKEVNSSLACELDQCGLFIGPELDIKAQNCRALFIQERKRRPVALLVLNDNSKRGLVDLRKKSAKERGA